MEAFGKRKVLKHALTGFGAIKSQIGGINMFAGRSIIDICGHCGSVQARIIFEVPVYQISLLTIILIYPSLDVQPADTTFVENLK
jgi:hypothetical protein